MRQALPASVMKLAQKTQVPLACVWAKRSLQQRKLLKRNPGETRCCGALSQRLLPLCLCLAWLASRRGEVRGKILNLVIGRCNLWERLLDRLLADLPVFYATERLECPADFMNSKGVLLPMEL